MHSPMFGIITPTILRPTLERTCDTINEQTNAMWRHIVMCDRPIRTEEDEQLLASIEHPFRTIAFCDDEHGKDYIGNPCRHNAFDLLPEEVNYVMYLDDDDYVSTQLFEKLSLALHKIGMVDAIVWPANRYGHRFFTIPPQLCHTVTGQYAYRKKPSNGKTYKWSNDPGYLEDGKFVDVLEAELHFIPVCEDEELTFIPSSNHGE